MDPGPGGPKREMQAVVLVEVGDGTPDKERINGAAGSELGAVEPGGQCLILVEGLLLGKREIGRRTSAGDGNTQEGGGDSGFRTERSCWNQREKPRAQLWARAQNRGVFPHPQWGRAGIPRFRVAVEKKLSLKSCPCKLLGIEPVWTGPFFRLIQALKSYPKQGRNRNKR
jgi:hypothetical protein